MFRLFRSIYRGITEYAQLYYSTLPISNPKTLNVECNNSTFDGHEGLKSSECHRFEAYCSTRQFISAVSLVNDMRTAVNSLGSECYSSIFKVASKYMNDLELTNLLLETPFTRPSQKFTAFSQLYNMMKQDNATLSSEIYEFLIKRLYFSGKYASAVTIVKRLESSGIQLTELTNLIFADSMLKQPHEWKSLLEYFLSRMDQVIANERLLEKFFQVSMKLNRFDLVDKWTVDNLPVYVKSTHYESLIKVLLGNNAYDKAFKLFQDIKSQTNPFKQANIQLTYPMCSYFLIFALKNSRYDILESTLKDIFSSSFPSNILTFAIWLKMATSRDIQSASQAWSEYMNSELPLSITIINPFLYAIANDHQPEEQWSLLYKIIQGNHVRAEDHIPAILSGLHDVDLSKPVLDILSFIEDNNIECDNVTFECISRLLLKKQKYEQVLEFFYKCKHELRTEYLNNMALEASIKLDSPDRVDQILRNMNTHSFRVNKPNLELLSRFKEDHK